jgi:hypothetical protein
MNYVGINELQRYQREVSIMLFIMIEKYFNDDACLNGREKKRID